VQRGQEFPRDQKVLGNVFSAGLKSVLWGLVGFSAPAVIRLLILFAGLSQEGMMELQRMAGMIPQRIWRDNYYFPWYWPAAVTCALVFAAAALGSYLPRHGLDFVRSLLIVSGVCFVLSSLVLWIEGAGKFPGEKRDAILVGAVVSAVLGFVITFYAGLVRSRASRFEISEV